MRVLWDDYDDEDLPIWLRMMAVDIPYLGCRVSELDEYIKRFGESDELNDSATLEMKAYLGISASMEAMI
jgi:hypothetical protein